MKDQNGGPHKPSPRETEILELMVKGLGGKQIVVRLRMSINTLKSHMTHMFARYGVKNGKELVAYYIINFRK